MSPQAPDSQSVASVIYGVSARSYMAIHAPISAIQWETERGILKSISDEKIRMDIDARFRWADAMLAKIRADQDISGAES